jgi:hypothetical protein
MNLIGLKFPSLPRLYSLIDDNCELLQFVKEAHREPQSFHREPQRNDYHSCFLKVIAFKMSFSVALRASLRLSVAAVANCLPLL